MKKFEEANLKVMLLENSVICTSGCACTADTQAYAWCQSGQLQGYTSGYDYV